MGSKWTITYRKSARKFVERLDPAQRRRIHDFLHTRLGNLPDIRSLGLALQGKEHSGRWRYRVGDYRIICEIRDRELLVLVIDIGHRRDVYT